MKLESLTGILKTVELEPALHAKILNLRGLLIEKNLPENHSIKFYEQSAMIEIFRSGFYINQLYFTFDGYGENQK